VDDGDFIGTVLSCVIRPGHRSSVFFCCLASRSSNR
jgi:hypothetical protein